MEMFNFIITDDMRGHGENKLNLGVEVKVNNIQAFRKQLNSALELFLQQENKAIASCNYLYKASAHKQLQNIEVEATELLKLLNTIYNKTESAFYDDRQLFSEKFTSLLSYIQEGQISCDLDKIGTVFTDFSEWIKTALSRKIDMCDKLAQLANRPLKAIVTFSEKGYETQFTKYHLNLEHFADFMHKMLKEEFNLQYMNSYYELESEHFSLMEKIKDAENIKIGDFLEAADKILQTQTKFDKLKRPFILAQINSKKIQDGIQGVIHQIYQISMKFEELYAAFSSQKARNVLELYIKIMGVIYKLPLKDFLSRKEADFLRFYDFVRTTSFRDEDLLVKRLLFCNLEKIEPILAERLKNKILNDFRTKENCTVFDSKGQFMVKKNERGFFDRSCFYTHTLLVYEFIPKRVDLVKNKYTLASGYDKTLIDRKTLRFSGKVYSALLNREIDYDIFLELLSYNINLSNHYSSKVS